MKDSVLMSNVAICHEFSSAILENIAWSGKHFGFRSFYGNRYHIVVGNVAVHDLALLVLRHLQAIWWPYLYEETAKTANIIESTSIRHRSDTFVSDRYLIDVDRMSLLNGRADAINGQTHLRFAWCVTKLNHFSVLLVLCAGNSPVTDEFPSQRPVTLSFDVFFDIDQNKRLSKRSWGLWFETPLCSLWRHCNETLRIPSVHNTCVSCLDHVYHYNASIELSFIQWKLHHDK